MSQRPHLLCSPQYLQKPHSAWHMVGTHSLNKQKRNVHQTCKCMYQLGHWRVKMEVRPSGANLRATRDRSSGEKQRDWHCLGSMRGERASMDAKMWRAARGSWAWGAVGKWMIREGIKKHWNDEQENPGWKGGEFMVKKFSALPLTSCATLGKLLNFGVPRFPHLYNENNNTVDLRVVRI